MTNLTPGETYYFALKARDDTEPPPDRIVINVMKKGTYRLKGVTYSQEALQSLLKNEAIQRTGPDGLSTQSVKIRADQATPYKYVQKVMLCCMNAKIWQVSFGVSPLDNSLVEKD